MGRAELIKPDSESDRQERGGACSWGQSLPARHHLFAAGTGSRVPALLEDPPVAGSSWGRGEWAHCLLKEANFNVKGFPACIPSEVISSSSPCRLFLVPSLTSACSRTSSQHSWVPPHAGSLNSMGTCFMHVETQVQGHEDLPVTVA